MVIQPIYNILFLPDVTYHFKKEFFTENASEQLEVGSELLFAFLRNEDDAEELDADHICPVGISARVEAFGDDDSVQIRTLERVDLSDVEVENGQILADASIRAEVDDYTAEEEKAQFLRLRAALLKFVQGYQWGMWARSFILQRKNMYDLGSALSEYLNISPEEKYAIVETDSRRERCTLIEAAINEFMEVAKVSTEAKEAQKDDQEQLYREAAIKKQISYLQKELDELHPENISDTRKFEKKIEESGMNDEARKEAEKVLNRMKQEGKDSHEYGLLYDYLDFMTSLDWKAPQFTPIDLDRAEQILDEDHYGLKKVKERIIQQLAVMALNRKQYGSILLFVGAPGTGKTSIGQSIARALGREYVRISLGGIRDEAEIRGHRRTYIGAMPGRIMEGIKRSGVSNPVIVLDEVDKLAKDYGGDPASALLEVLDPEQNSTFTDHYMNVPYDLSNVLFVCTANSLDTIPEPLLNRMEVINFSGYTAVEKYQIARRHLLPKALDAMGIKKNALKVTDGAIRRIIDEYTMEAGVRDLKKLIDTLCRTAAVQLVKNEGTTLTVTKTNLEKYLGKKQLHHERKLSSPEPGVVTGLAWTRAGGEILFIESKLIPGKGKMIITGQLGDVMKESIQIALSLVKSLTLTTALASLLTGKKVSPEYAMTGEVSLRGGVMPIGGLPEKLMAAQRAGITKVLIPADNEQDLDDVADEVKNKLEIVPVKKVTEVLKLVLK